LNSRERVICTLNLEEPDAVPVQDDPWPETINRWIKEGYPTSGVEPKDYFGYAFVYISCDISPRYESFVLEEDERTRVATDGWGSVNKHWKGRYGTPSFLRPAFKSLEEFKEKIEPYIDINDPRKLISPNYPFRKDLEKGIKNLQERYFVCASFIPPFEIMRALLGTKELIVSFIREPKAISYIFDVLGDLLTEAGKSLIDAGVDGLWAWEDLAYSKGPFISPQHYRKFLAPVHKRMFSVFRKRDLPVIYHTDGEVRMLIPNLIESGVTALQPLEAKAGIDVRELKEKYGNELAFIGNMDVRKLSGTLEDVEEEFMSKVPVAAEGGGYILHSDHSIPPSVSFENYQYLLKLNKKFGRYSM